MKYIHKLIEELDDEICGAKNYAESYLEHKAKGTAWASKYREMANDELKHCNYIHERLVAEIEELSKMYVPTSEMQDEWDASHKKYVEKVAWIKQMLAM